MNRLLALAAATLLLAAPALAAPPADVDNPYEGARHLEINKTAPAFYPGYGAADPAYDYRPGKELSTELVKSEWVIRHLTIFAKDKRTMVVSTDILQAMLSQMPDLKVIKRFSVPLQFGVVAAAQVEFTANATLFFRNEVKMGHHQVWFELFRAKKGFWPWMEWELCGKTYEFHDWPVSDEVGREFKVI